MAIRFCSNFGREPPKGGLAIPTRIQGVKIRFRTLLGHEKCLAARMSIVRGYESLAAGDIPVTIEESATFQAG